MKGRKPRAASSRTTDTKLAVKKTAKGAKDPNKPKRPPTAFFVFLAGFRIQFKEKHPNNKSVSAVGKACGEKWKSLSESEKAPFLAKAEKLKAEYLKKMAAYEKGEQVEVQGDESDKSKSEVNDGEDDDGSEEGGEEEDDD